MSRIKDAAADKEENGGGITTVCKEVVVHRNKQSTGPGVTNLRVII
jgi:hypothetical protein